MTARVVVDPAIEAEKIAECTDVSNAHELNREYGTDMRFVHAWDKWLIWDGRVWQLDHTSEAMRKAMSTVTRLYARYLEEAKACVTAIKAYQKEHLISDDDMKSGTMGAEHVAFLEPLRRKAGAAQAKAKWAKDSHAHARLKAMLALCSSLEGVAVSHEALDADHFALSCQNGTLNLRTGKLRQHRRADLITKMVPCAYDPDAQAPTWETFLETSLVDPELVSFVQRFTGYSLTGDIREHALLFFYGSGGNGKSTYLNVVRDLLGPYSVGTPRGFLFPVKGAERHPTELVGLLGARMATCAEVAEGRSLDEGLIKDLTGGDVIRARRMKEDFWDFKPTHKLFLAGNHKPKIYGDDEGIWRRIRLVPWTVTIAKKDKTLPEKLAAEMPGVLAWAVRGCLDWQKDGLGCSAAVEEATAAYRKESDPCAEFLASGWCDFLQADSKVTRKAVSDAYASYQATEGARVATGEKLAQALRRRGVLDCKVWTPSGNQRGWKGLRILTSDEKRNQDRDTGSPRDTPSGVSANGNNNSSSHIYTNPQPGDPGCPGDPVTNQELLDWISPPDDDLH